MGLAIGIGFYEVAIISCFFLSSVLTVLHKADLHYRAQSNELDIYAELKHIAGVTNFMNAIKLDGTKISNLELKKAKELDNHMIGLKMILTLPEKINYSEYILKLHSLENVLTIEEIV